MLLNLKTIHKPATIEEAVALLAEPGTYPLYGGVALQRTSDPAVEAGIDLANLELDYVRDSENSLRLGSMLTLEQVRQVCAERGEEYPRLGAIADILGEEMPEAQRNTMRLGDLLMERDPQSLTLTLFMALGGVIKRIDADMHFTMTAWYSNPGEIARYLIAHIRIPRRPTTSVVAHEKVARTPADAPIVGAVACVDVNPQGQPYFYTTLAVCGASPTPLPQAGVARALDETGDLDMALGLLTLDPPDDYLGSREYRAVMARTLSRRVLSEAMEKAQQMIGD